VVRRQYRVQQSVNAPPDGYTMLLIPTSATINATLYDSLPYNILRDIAPVSGLASSPNVIDRQFCRCWCARWPSSSASQGQSGKVNLASPGPARPFHMAARMFQGS